MLAAVPDRLLHRTVPAGAEPYLLLPRREGGGSRGGRIRRPGGEGAVEVSDGSLLGRGRDGGYDFADSVPGGLLLDLEDVGDGILELREGGVVLWSYGEGFEPWEDLWSWVCWWGSGHGREMGKGVCGIAVECCEMKSEQVLDWARKIEACLLLRSLFQGHLIALLRTEAEEDTGTAL